MHFVCRIVRIAIICDVQTNGNIVVSIIKIVENDRFIISIIFAIIFTPILFMQEKMFVFLYFPSLGYQREHR